MVSVLSNRLYTAEVSSTGGRQGRAVSNDDVLDLSLSRPGSKGDGTNPEQLMAAGWSACFLSAMTVVAQGRDFEVSGAMVTVRVTLGTEVDGSYAISAEIEVTIPGLSKDQVEELALGAHEVCPYSKATRGNIEVSVIARG